MAIRRTSRTATRDDDRGVAAVVGFVLVFAMAISYYGYIAKQDVPRWGAASEQEWDALVGSAMSQLARDSAISVGSHSAVGSIVPRPPMPQSFDIPLVGRTQPVDPSGSLAFRKECSALQVSRDGQPFVSAGGGGCLRFAAQPVYSSAFGYAIENGALLRVQGSEAVVQMGPPLSLRVLVDAAGDPTRYDVALTAVGFTGDAAAVSVDRLDVPVSLVAGGSLSQVSQLPNAREVRWDVTSDHAEAWARWLNQRIRMAGFDDALNRACVAGDAHPACAGAVVVDRHVLVVLKGPTDDPLGPPDISFSLHQGTYSVSLR